MKIPAVLFLLTAALCGPLMAGEQPEFLDLKWKRSSLGRSTGQSALAVDAAGNTHTLVTRVIKGQHVLTHTWFEGRRKSSEVVTTEEVGPRAALAIDGQGGLHACYSTQIPGGSQLTYAYNDGTGWTEEAVEVGGQSLSIRIDEQGIPHIVHIDGNFSSDVRHAWRTAEGWQSELIADDGLWFGDTSLLLRAGKVHVTYTRADFTRSVMAATRDVAGTWSIETVDVSGMHASAAFDVLGTLHVLYTFGALKHATRTDDGWVSEDVVTSNEFFGLPFPDGVTSIAEDAEIALGPQGRMMLVGVLTLSKGNGFANALFVAPLVGLTIYPDILKVSPFLGTDLELAVDSHGLAHMTVGQGQRTNLYRLKGKRLKLNVKAKGAGEVTASVGGAACDSSCKLGFFPGLDVTLTATPADGYSFVGWRGSHVGTEPVFGITLDGNKKVSARFTPASAP